MNPEHLEAFQILEECGKQPEEAIAFGNVSFGQLRAAIQIALKATEEAAESDADTWLQFER